MRIKQKWIWVISFLYSLPSLSGEFHLKFIPPSSQKIEKLSWNQDKETQEPQLQRREIIGKGSSYFVVLRGKLSSNQQKLLYTPTDLSSMI